MRMCKTFFFSWREGRWGRTYLDIVLADFDGILDDGNLSIFMYLRYVSNVKTLLTERKGSKEFRLRTGSPIAGGGVCSFTLQ